MTPEEIKGLRLSLGLTQVEAGELLGGGPRAFTKYEAGTVKPSLSSVMARFGSRVRTRTSTTMPTARTYWSTSLAPATK